MTEMAREFVSVQLTEAQSRYLESLRVAGGLTDGVWLKGLAIEGSPGAIEALRETLTQRLAERGFAPDYSTTAEGDLIEDLIDALHIDSRDGL